MEKAIGEREMRGVEGGKRNDGKKDLFSLFVFSSC